MLAQKQCGSKAMLARRAQLRCFFSRPSLRPLPSSFLLPSFSSSRELLVPWPMETGIDPPAWIRSRHGLIALGLPSSTSPPDGDSKLLLDFSSPLTLSSALDCRSEFESYFGDDRTMPYTKALVGELRDSGVRSVCWRSAIAQFLWLWTAPSHSRRVRNPNHRACSAACR